MRMGVCSALLFHDHLLCLDHFEGEVVVLAPHFEVFDLLSIVCLNVVGDQAYNFSVVCKLNDGVGVVLGHTVMGEQGVQERTEHSPLRGPRVEDQRGRRVVAYPYQLGAARQEVQNPVAEEGVSSQGP
jgi:hypothetical protein